jgi:hypothetical protein
LITTPATLRFTFATLQHRNLFSQHRNEVLATFFQTLCNTQNVSLQHHMKHCGEQSHHNIAFVLHATLVMKTPQCYLGLVWEMEESSGWKRIEGDFGKF